MSNRGYHLNATGSELTTDMACPSTIEPFKLDKDAEEFFYDELNTKSLTERVEYIAGVVQRHRQLVGTLIVDNNELGRALMERLPEEQFVISNKQPNGRHWFYQVCTRLKAVEPEPEKVPQEQPKSPVGDWLESALGLPPVGDTDAERDFVNIWTAQPQLNLETATPEQLRAEVALLRNHVSHYRRDYGNPAEQLFELIKHGDAKHQAWLKAALVAYYDGQPIPREKDMPTDVIGKRVPSNVQFVNGAPTGLSNGTQDRSDQ